MPVWKYRSVADMPRLMPENQTRLALRIAACWERGQLRPRPTFVRGVQKFRSLEAAQQARNAHALSDGSKS